MDLDILQSIDPRELGRRLQEARRARGRTQQDAAERLGVAPEAAAEDVASAERNRLGLGDGPILNLRELLDNDVGLRIFYLDLPSNVAAMFAYTEQLGGCIAVNRKHPEDRRRMSLGHDY